MKKISLTTAEFSHLREIYLTELEKAQHRIEHLTAILKKLDAEIGSADEDKLLSKDIKRIAKPIAKADKPKKISTSSKEVSSQDQKEIVSSTVDDSKKSDGPKELKRRGRPKQIMKTKQTRIQIKKGTGANKVKWNDFVMESIVREGKPVLSSSISTNAINRFKVKQVDASRVKQVVSGALSKLVSVDKRLKTQKIPNSREKYYGLSEWFKENGELMPEYLEKINL